MNCAFENDNYFVGLIYFAAVLSSRNIFQKMFDLCLFAQMLGKCMTQWLEAIHFVDIFSHQC